jgi:hypothetical protein
LLGKVIGNGASSDNRYQANGIGGGGGRGNNFECFSPPLLLSPHQYTTHTPSSKVMQQSGGIEDVGGVCVNNVARDKREVMLGLVYSRQLTFACIYLFLFVSSSCPYYLFIVFVLLFLFLLLFTA